MALTELQRSIFRVLMQGKAGLDTNQIVASVLAEGKNCTEAIVILELHYLKACNFIKEDAHNGKWLFVKRCPSCGRPISK